jgi:hypothetical protein
MHEQHKLRIVDHGICLSGVPRSFGGSAAGCFSSGSKQAHIEPSMTLQWQWGPVMIVISQTNWSIAAASSAANIPPQRTQLIPLLPASGLVIWADVPPMACHAVIPVESL